MNHNIVYGLHAVLAIIEHAADTLECLIIQKGATHASLLHAMALAKQQGVRLRHQSKAELDSLTHNAKHQGIVALRMNTSLTLNESSLLPFIEALPHPAFLLILDGIQDPHNLGACLRSAAAANVDAVIIPKDKSVGLTPTACKVASGGAELCPFVQVTNLSRVLTQLKTLGVWLYGTEASAAQTIFDVDVTTSMAWVLGAEGSGLRLNTRKACDYAVSIPMPGKMESLNVSVAAGICLFETVRQRSLLPAKR